MNKHPNSHLRTNANQRIAIHRIFLVVFALVLLGGLASTAKLTLAQSSVASTIYAATYDEDTHANSVWQLAVSNSSAKRLFTIPYVSSKSVKEAFPSREYSKLIEAVAQGAVPKELIEGREITQSIQNVWDLDNNQLLILTRNELCERISGTCFGFYEFLLRDIAGTREISLAKLSYRNEILERWKGCLGTSEFDPVYVDSVLPNPIQSNFAFVLKAKRGCSGQERTQVFILDYAVSPVTIHEIPFSSGIAWSPDGNDLAYYSSQNCKNDSCDGSVNVYSTAPQKNTILYAKRLLSSFPVVIGWIDDNSLLHSWLISDTGGEGEPVLLTHDLINKTIEKSHQSFGNSVLTDLLFMRDTQTKLVGITSDSTLIQFPSTMKGVFDLSSLQRLNSVPMIYYYNMKHSEYLLMTQNISSGKVIALDTESRQTAIDLFAFRDIPEKEHIFLVTPG